MKKRLLSLLVCAGMVGSMLTGCGGSGGASGETQGGTTQAASAQAGTEAGTKGQEASGEAVELTFWSMAQRKDFEDKIIAAFTEKNPQIKITPTYYSTCLLYTSQRAGRPVHYLPQCGGLERYAKDRRDAG